MDLPMVGGMMPLLIKILEEVASIVLLLVCLVCMAVFFAVLLQVMVK